MNDDFLNVEAMDLSEMPNDLYIDFHGVQLGEMDHEFDVDNPAPAQLAPMIESYRQAYNVADGAYKYDPKSALTEQIAKADDERDPLVDEVDATIKWGLKRASAPLIQQAAETMKRSWEHNKPSTKAAYEAENTALFQWYQEYQASADMQAAATTLGIDQTIELMMQKTQLVHDLIIERNRQQGQQAQQIKLADARVLLDKAYKKMIQVLNSLAVIDADPDRFANLIGSLNQQQQYFREQAESRKRANKRVSVKSPIVGNKLYAVSRGWTWSQLIADGKAALAIDGETFPEQIVSTDKKALKAGGLVLTLGGYAVRPDDEIDVDVDYELIAPGSVIPDPSDGGGDNPQPSPEPSPDDQGGGSGGEVTPVTPE